MKTLNKIIGAALLTISLNSFAGDCPALSGQYTIGKNEGSDFSSVADAINALKCGGIEAAVTFRLEPGVYSEKITLSAIHGASAYNTVTFESKTGDNTTAVISYSTSDATMILNSASNISFNNITIRHSNAVYGNAMRVDGKTNNIHFKGVIFDGVEVARSGANSAAVYFTSNAPMNDVSLEDCEINNGSIGIVKGGMSADTRDTKTSITGTLFFNQYEGGMALVNEDAPVITSNVISSLSAYKGFTGINLDNVTNNLIIANNIVTIVNGSVGLSMNNCLAQATNMGHINNNSISVGGKEQASGIKLSGSTDNQIINFNRIKLTTTGPQAYYSNNASGNNVNLMNNIMYDLKTGAYTIIGNSYKDYFNQLPGQSNASLTASANGIMVEKVSPIK